MTQDPHQDSGHTPIAELQATVDRLDAIAEIDRKISEYYWGFDNRILDLVDGVLHPEASLKTGGASYDSKEQWLHYVEKIAWPRVTEVSHHAVNRTIRLTGVDTAVAKFHGNAWVLKADGNWTHATSTNTDSWVRVGGAWLLRDRLQESMYRHGVLAAASVG